MCDLYVVLGVDLGDSALWRTRRQVAGRDRHRPAVGPAGPLDAPAYRSFTAFASGWMRVRGRARQRGVELPLVVSDHCDWPELIPTIAETGAEEIWVTHGREDALVHQIGLMGKRGRALALVGWEDEERNEGSLRRACLDPPCAYTAPARNCQAAADRGLFPRPPDPDRGWALCALTDGLPFSLPMRRTLTE